MLTMLPVITKKGINVMSSVDLAKLCVGDKKNAHSHFLAKAEKVLGSDLPNFWDIYFDNHNRRQRCLMLPEREACLMAMSYSYELQAYVFDEWQKLKAPKPITEREQLLLMAQTVIQQQEEIALLEQTKAQINDKRTATLMNKASQDAKRIKKLESQLQDVGTYQSLIAADLPQRTETELNPRAQTWRVLKKISDDLGLPPKKVKDERYGEVNTYHVSVIEKYKELYFD